MKLIKGHWYRFDDRGYIHIGEYMGRQEEFECSVCGKGHNTHTFNVWHSQREMDYETWGYGNEHLPEMIEDLGVMDEILVDKA